MYLVEKYLSEYLIECIKNIFYKLLNLLFFSLLDILYILK